MDKSSIYHALGRLLEQTPDIPGRTWPVPADVQTWAARAFAVVSAMGNPIDVAEMRIAVDALHSAAIDLRCKKIVPILQRSFAVAETHMPPGVQGTFVPAGGHFDTFAAISKLFQRATSELMVVDPYMDESVLTKFGSTIPAGIAVKLLSAQGKYLTSLREAGIAWTRQYGPAKPITVRVTDARALHDRAVFIDGDEAWTLTQSLKNFAERAPAEIVRVSDFALEKNQAYHALWSSAEEIALA